MGEKKQSHDEWVATKQACRDELVVYLFFSPIYICVKYKEDRILFGRFIT